MFAISPKFKNRLVAVKGENGNTPPSRFWRAAKEKPRVLRPWAAIDMRTLKGPAVKFAP
jgi:hypothetical protein